VESLALTHDLEWWHINLETWKGPAVSTTTVL